MPLSRGKGGRELAIRGKLIFADEEELAASSFRPSFLMTSYSRVKYEFNRLFFRSALLLCSVRLRHPSGTVPAARHGSLEAVLTPDGDVGSPRNASRPAAVPEEEGQIP